MGTNLAAAAFVVVIAAAGAYPPLTLPSEWTPYATPSSSPALVGHWRRPPRGNEPYPTRLLYYANVGNATYDEEVARVRKFSTCPAGQTGELMKSIRVCGFVVDADEQCKGKPVHRFVRLANLGPPEVVALTQLLVPWPGGYLEIEYYRPGTEFAPSGKGEKEDDVLAAMRTWCEAAVTSASSSAIPNASPSP